MQHTQQQHSASIPSLLKKKAHKKNRLRTRITGDDDSQNDSSRPPSRATKSASGGRVRRPKPSKYEEEMALEQTISQILLRRFECDIARLFSTHIHRSAVVQVPKVIIALLKHVPPGWIALNAGTEEIKDLFRSILAFEMRQAGERVATKSVLWSYIAILHFAMSHDVSIKGREGLHSKLLLPHHPHMRAYLRTLDAACSPDLPRFSKPPYLGGLDRGYKDLEAYCVDRLKNAPMGTFPPDWLDWRKKIREGYERMVETLWDVANEIEPKGYGLMLRERLSDKWCCLSCLGTYLEVCEHSLRTSDTSAPPQKALPQLGGLNSGHSSKGKEREWDGRGLGVPGWETADEDDLWKSTLDFSGEYQALYLTEDETEDVLTVGELMELRYVRAEREKELGNRAFKKAQFGEAVQHYERAYKHEPEVPYYQLNLAAAHLKMHNWKATESACTLVLSQQKNNKAYYRRGKAREMDGRPEEAIEDYKAILESQPSNTDALAALDALLRPERVRAAEDSYPSPPASPHAAYSSPASCSHPRPYSPLSMSSPSIQARLKQLQPLKLNERPIPWDICEKDRMRVRIGTAPLKTFIDPAIGMEAFHYPIWDKVAVLKVD